MSEFKLMTTALDAIEKVLEYKVIRPELKYLTLKLVNPHVSFPCDGCKNKEVNHVIKLDNEETLDLCDDCKLKYDRGEL